MICGFSGSLHERLVGHGRSGNFAFPRWQGEHQGEGFVSVTEDNSHLILHRDKGEIFHNE
jgi:hypothetical protein